MYVVHGLWSRWKIKEIHTCPLMLPWLWKKLKTDKGNYTKYLYMQHAKEKSTHNEDLHDNKSITLIVEEPGLISPLMHMCRVQARAQACTNIPTHNPTAKSQLSTKLSTKLPENVWAELFWTDYCTIKEITSLLEIIWEQRCSCSEIAEKSQSASKICQQVLCLQFSPR